jgi:multimeric flavodoxin WrbA
MKILGLSSSPKGSKSITLRLVEEGVAGAKGAGAEGTIIDVSSMRILRCKGCAECYRTGHCVQDDDFSFVLESMLAADGLIVGSPSYTGDVTPKAECLMERMGDVVRCRLLENKYGFSVCVSRHGDEDQVAARLNHFLNSCGVVTTGSLCVSAGIAGSPDGAMAEARDLGADLVAAVSERRVYPRQEEERARFLVEFSKAVRENKAVWDHDYEHWLKKGWIK